MNAPAPRIRSPHPRQNHPRHPPRRPPPRVLVRHPIRCGKWDELPSCRSRANVPLSALEQLLLRKDLVLLVPCALKNFA